MKYKVGQDSLISSTKHRWVEKETDTKCDLRVRFFCVCEYVLYVKYT